jgi:hypothetical protein
MSLADPGRRRAMYEVPWVCEAYGPDGLEFGAVCFVGDLNRRVCESAGECHAVMTAERRRVFDRIGELAAEGDPTGVFLAGEFASPDQLLNAAPDVAGPAELGEGGRRYNADRVGRCVCPPDDPCGACPDDIPDHPGDDAG